VCRIVLGKLNSVKCETIDRSICPAGNSFLHVPYLESTSHKTGMLSMLPLPPVSPFGISYHDFGKCRHQLP
jgi:hypothetical protein